ncbi:MAG: SPOR domain-containing protein, partial [Polaromonas sp.]
MLRLLVLLLVLANAGYFGWTHGLLAPYGFAPVTQSEPQRITQQLHPEALRILTPVETRQLDAAISPV